jgi:hypothetical protein
MPFANSYGLGHREIPLPKTGVSNTLRPASPQGLEPLRRLRVWLRARIRIDRHIRRWSAMMVDAAAGRLVPVLPGHRRILLQTSRSDAGIARPRTAARPWHHVSPDHRKSDDRALVPRRICRPRNRRGPFRLWRQRHVGGGRFRRSALWWFLLSGAASLLRHRFTPGTMLWVNRSSGLLTFGFGIAALFHK